MANPILCTAFPEDTECEWCWAVFGEGEIHPGTYACHCGRLHTLDEPHMVWLEARQCILPGEREGWSACYCLAPEMAPDDCCDCMSCVGRRTWVLANR